MNMKLRQINVALDEETYLRLKAIAKEDGRSLRNYVLTVLRRHIRQLDARKEEYPHKEKESFR